MAGGKAGGGGGGRPGGCPRSAGGRPRTRRCGRTARSPPPCRACTAPPRCGTARGAPPGRSGAGACACAVCVCVRVCLCVYVCVCVWRGWDSRWARAPVDPTPPHPTRTTPPPLAARAVARPPTSPSRPAPQGARPHLPQQAARRWVQAGGGLVQVRDWSGWIGGHEGVLHGLDLPLRTDVQGPTSRPSCRPAPPAARHAPPAARPPGKAPPRRQACRPVLPCLSLAPLLNPCSVLNPYLPVPICPSPKRQRDGF
jgi:hypothetical protein